MNNRLNILFLLLCFFIGNSAVKKVHSQNKYKTISVTQSDSLIKANALNPNFVILDVRRATEWNNNHLQGSIFRDYYQSDFRQQLDKLPKHKIFLIHCHSGSRSAKAFAIMQELGFTDVYNMSGGITAWQNNSLPVTKDVEPLLMLVSHQGKKGESSDTIHVTVTNRANDQLVFNSVVIDDNHAIEHNFDHDITLEGAEDYTFSIYHSPTYEHEDSTSVLLESNGGNLSFKVRVAQNVATDAQQIANVDFEIYPNPTSNKIYFRGLQEEIILEIRIYNLNGQCVLHKNNHPRTNSLSLATVKPGLHVLQITNGDAIISKKMLIKR